VSRPWQRSSGTISASSMSSRVAPAAGGDFYVAASGDLLMATGKCPTWRHEVPDCSLVTGIALKSRAQVPSNSVAPGFGAPT
jgi:hypothetical protein